jgi:hypothetical protein
LVAFKTDTDISQKASVRDTFSANAKEPGSLTEALHLVVSARQQLDFQTREERVNPILMSNRAIAPPLPGVPIPPGNTLVQEARRREQEKRDREEREKQRFDTAVPPAHPPQVRCPVRFAFAIRVHDLTPSCFPSTRTRANSKFIVFVSYIPVQHSILLTDAW